MARRWRRTSIVTAAGLLILLAAIVLGRHWLAERVIVWQLQEAGFSSASADVRHLGLTSLHVENLIAGDGITIAEAVVVRHGWDLSDWKVRLTGAEVRARLEDGALAIDGFGTLASLGDGGPAGQVRIPDITLTGVSILLDTPQGNFDVRLPGSISAGSESPLTAESLIRVSGDLVEAEGRIESIVDTSGAARIDADLDTVRLVHKSDGLEAGAVRLTADIQSGFADLNLEGRLPGLDLGFKVRILADAPWQNPVIDASGELVAGDLAALRLLSPDLVAVAGETRIFWAFGGVVEPEALLATATRFQAVEGDLVLEAHGRLGVEGVADSIAHDLSVRGVIAEGAFDATVDRADFALTGLDPIIVPQAIRPDGDLPLVGDAVEFSVIPGSRIAGFQLKTNGLAMLEDLAFSGELVARSLADVSIRTGNARQEKGNVLIADPVVSIKGPINGSTLKIDPYGSIRLSAGAAVLSGGSVDLEAPQLDVTGLAPGSTLALAGNAGLSLQAEALTLASDGAVMSGMTASLTGMADGSRVSLAGDGRLTGEAATFTGELLYAAPSVSNRNVTIASPMASLPVALVADTEDGRIDITGGAVEIGSARFGPDILIEDRSSLRVDGSLKLGPCTFADCPLNPAMLDLRLKAGRLAIAASGLEDIEITRPEVRFTARDLGGDGLPNLAMTFALARAATPSLGSVEDVRIRGPVNLNRFTLNHEISAARVETRPIPDLPLPSFRLEGRADGPLTDARFQGRMTPIGVDLPAATVLATASSITGRMTEMPAAKLVALPALKAWLPEDLNDVEGQVTLRVTYDFPSSSAQIDADLISIGAATDVGSFSGLSGTIRTVSVSPFVTDGPQQFSVDLIDAGTPLTDIRFALDAGLDQGAPVLRVSDLTGEMFGGRFRFDPVTVSEDSIPELSLHVTGLSLQQFSDLAGFDDFSMGGTVSGTVPFAIDAENRIAIRDARLAADGPGVMRLNLESVRGAVEQKMGDQADLLLTALENFEYDVLTAHVTKAFGENEQAKLRLEGRNPGHLDGQPFIFNISLDSNVVRLADTILALYRATLGEVQELARKASADR